ncbi:hypothetical protein MBOT_36130 [Mycobacterium botniense]|uniref:Transposase DDE domain-containing protein n=1 Tax=Mycobacterium botniense TaxID=84962 RepID=A0A7I9Y2E9_9MYCO|nr:hypothetical protein MBOT_36130 [Mycobacterium botniense]
MSVSTPPTCRRFAPHGRLRGRRPGLAEPPPAPGQPLYIDIDATVVIDHSDNKQDAAPTWKKSFGHHPLLALLDLPEIADGEALAGLLRKGSRLGLSTICALPRKPAV